MTTYESLLWLHVSFAVLWAGGAILLAVLGAKVSTGPAEERVYFAEVMGWLGQRYFGPVAVLTLVFGVWLAIDGEWDFGSTWISAAFVGFAISFLTGAAYFDPVCARISRRVEEHGADDPQAQAMISRLLVVTALNSFVLLVIIYVMTTKPGM